MSELKKAETNQKRRFKKTMTEKALEANRNNAKKSTGPKFKKRTQLVLPSNFKHGILASIPVLPFIENQKEWEEFVIGLKNDLEPNGTLENLLVERIATLYWRLGRLERYQHEKLTRDINNVPQDVASKWKPKPGTDTQFDILTEYEACDAGQVEKEAKIYPKVLNLIDDLYQGKQKDELNQDLAREVVKISAELYVEFVNKKELEKPEKERSLKGVNEKYLENDFTDSKKIVKILKDDAKNRGITYKEHLGCIYARAEDYSEKAQASWKRMKVAIESRRLDKLSPFESPIGNESIIKLEAHINRQILQNLHELQRMQGMRIGISRPPEAIDVTGVEV